ncbi:MAG TPA: knotted carbamoyltransferase YgeW [Planctomycetota bacterium]|nr:knotted carbamoyltransferase YgeW [Planctomycetota bacterium]HRU51921.1 knotted carbamoyltransferase YgeW [Planctomycetota bacterium]
MSIIQNNLSILKNLQFDMHQKDFLITWEKTDAELKATLLLAECLKELHRQGKALRIFESGISISIFRDNSTRTRFSFLAASDLLGLGLTELDEEKSQISHGETVRETANMISFLAEVIGIRDDIYLHEGDKYMREVSTSVQEGYDKGILHRRPSVISLQSDIDHPTQALADLLQLKNHFGSFEALRGKKLAMTWAYSPSYGKPLSVPQGLIGLLPRLGMDISLAYPEGYGLIPEVVEVAKKEAEKNNAKFEIVNSMEEAFKDADTICAKSWAPYHIMERRTDLLKKSDKEGLIALEKECLANNAKFQNWECDAEKMALSKGGNALYLHPLPADISGVNCKQGEITKEVFDKVRIDTYRQASYKPFVVAAMIFLTRMEKPIEKLEALIKADKARF